MNKKSIFIIVSFLLFISLFIITGCGDKSVKEKTKQKNETEIVEADKEKTALEDNEANTKEKRFMHDYFDTNKFDKSIFSGIIYDSNGNPVKVLDAISQNGGEKIVISDLNYDYYFTSDRKEERNVLHDKLTSDEDLEFIKEKFGNPKCIYEHYSMKEDIGPTGSINLVYDYDQYVVDIRLLDYSMWYKYPYTSPTFFYCDIMLRDDYINNLEISDGTEIYGERISD